MNIQFTYIYAHIYIHPYLSKIYIYTYIPSLSLSLKIDFHLHTFSLQQDSFPLFSSHKPKPKITLLSKIQTIHHHPQISSTLQKPPKEIFIFTTQAKTTISYSPKYKSSTTTHKFNQNHHN